MTAPTRPPLSRGKRIAFTGILVFLVLGVAEGLAALYLNVLAANPRSLAERNVPWHVYEPYRNHALGPGWHSAGRIHDAQGFRRAADVQTVKPPDVYRIFLMGGSAAYGLPSAPPFPPLNITNEQTIDAKLERLLAPLFPGLRIEVINAAVTAYWTHHHLIYLHETLLDYDPDLVIFLDGINDYYHHQPDHRQFASYRYSMTLAVETLNTPTFSEALQVFTNWGKQHSNLLYVGREGLSRLLGWDAAPEDPCNAEVVPPERLNDQLGAQYEAIARRTWVRTLRSNLSLLRENGIEAITALQPELIFESSAGRSPGDRRLLDIEVGNRPKFYAERKAFLRPIAARLAGETAEGVGATFVDLTDVFDDQAQYFIDYCHLSEAGAERIAERLLPSVRARIAATAGRLAAGSPAGPVQGG
jgi:lysophospholipase L1-like esterase